MSRILNTLICLVAALTLISCQPAATPTNVAETSTLSTPTEAKKAPATDLEQLSNRLVSQVAAVKEGDTVIINGGVRDLELLENLATDTRKVGAHPLVTLTSDRVNKKYFEEVPEKYDSQAPEINLKLATMATVSFNVDSNETEGLLAGVPPARFAAIGKANQPVVELFRKRNVRVVEVGNGLYPTEWRAKRFGMTQDELTKAFWTAVNTDYSALQTSGERVKSALAAGKEVHITNPNGTDLKMRIEGRPFFVSDGIISEEDVKKGGPAVSVYLPAGEVYCAPVPGTAEGKVVVSRDFYQGKEITDLTLTFVAGKLTSMSGSGPGFADFKAAYDASGEGKELFGFVDFGINPNFSVPAASKLGNWIQAGMVTVGTGNNTWAGGENNISYGMIEYLPGSTVTLDGKTILENGVLRL
ncbi:MAG: aminopeptidase [Pyrinomonadaceae bacterium]